MRIHTYVSALNSVVHRRKHTGILRCMRHAGRSTLDRPGVYTTCISKKKWFKAFSCAQKPILASSDLTLTVPEIQPQVLLLGHPAGLSGGLYQSPKISSIMRQEHLQHFGNLRFANFDLETCLRVTYFCSLTTTPLTTKNGIFIVSEKPSVFDLRQRKSKRYF